MADLKEVSCAPQIFGESESPYFIFISQSVETLTDLARRPQSNDVKCFPQAKL